jgi:beta-N-acetylhexosaminidase
VRRRSPALAVPAAGLTLLAVLAGLPADAQETGGTRPAASPSAPSSLSRSTQAAAIPSGYAGSDPATWSTHRLAAQLVFSCVDVGHLDRARRQAAAGIGGITLLGSNPPARLRARLQAVSAAARTPVLPFLASDEEGGTVQRLRDVIYRLPSARTMGTGRPARIRRTAEAYGVRMRRLGVRMELAPVADLAVPGRYIDSLGRAFSSDPLHVAADDRAWRLGMRDARVVTVLKHWPGHGSATNSHIGPARVPPLDRLEGRDLVPFERELADGAPVVMVGHLLSRGLTTGDVPASLSPRALGYLRRSAGPDVVVLTDSLAMAAASSSLGISPARAAVRALQAGADWAMACDASPLQAVTAVRRALDSGALDRPQAEASARRILELKARWGLAPRADGATGW